MPSLPFNFLIPEKLYGRVRFVLTVLPIGFMFAAFIPLWAVAMWFSNVLGIPDGAPIKEQPYGPLWFALFLVSGGFFMVAGYVLGWVANACICRFIFGWRLERVRSVFLLSDVPSEWLAPNANDTMSGSNMRQPRWAVVRLQGRIHYVLTRGVLGWGIPMYAVMTLVPSLRADPSPTAFYFLWQAALWGCAGALFGAVIWHFSERQFLRQRKFGGGHENAI